MVTGEKIADEFCIQEAYNIFAIVKIPVAQSELMILLAIENLLKKLNKV